MATPSKLTGLASVITNPAHDALMYIVNNPGDPIPVSSSITPQNLFGGIVDVRQYGALGDGIADDTAALNAAWAAVTDSSVLQIPSGIYLVSDTVSWINHDNVVIYGHKAIIKTKAGANFTGKAQVSFAGLNYSHVYDLEIISNLAVNEPEVGMCLARVDAGDGGFNIFDGCNFSGLYNFATYYNVDAELNTFLSCYFQSLSVNPAIYISTNDDAGIGVRDDITSCVCHRFYSCSVANYSAVAGQKAVVCNLVIKEVSFRDTYFALGEAGRVISLEGAAASMYNLILDNVRVEGPNQANSRLVYNGQNNACNNMTLKNINWTIVSDYIIEAATSGFIYSDISVMNFEVGCQLMKVSANVQYNTIIGRGDAMIDVDAGDYFSANHVIWFGDGLPFTGAGAYGAYNRDDNTLLRHYDANTENSGAVNRRYGAGIADASGATPSVKGMNLITLGYAAPVTITDFTGHIPGQELKMISATVNHTIQHNANIKLNGSVDFVMGSGDTLTLEYFDNIGAWYEMGRMVA